jgi:hypothetical protein
MFHELVDFFKRILIQQHRDALARRQLAVGLLPLNALCPATKLGGAVHFQQAIDPI